jgi:flagellar biosynthesis protein FlhG
MADQAERLRKLVIDAAPSVRGAGALPPTIVVTGGKGGVGATTVAINLAATLAQHGRRTVLVDAAPNADAAHLVGIDVERGHTLEDVLAGSLEAADALSIGPAGITLLAGQWASAGSPDRSPKSLDRLLEQLHPLCELADALVIDAGSGVTNWTRGLWQEAEMVLVVTTPDDVAVMDTYATIKRCIAANENTDENIDVRVLVNACQDAATATDVQSRLSASCRRFLGRSIGRAPLVSRHLGELDTLQAPPLAWETLASPFARNIHQLGRFADDVLSQHKRTRRHDYELSTC